jgi:hypothetical protein
MPKLHADSFFKMYLEHLRVFKSKSEETHEWVDWLQEKTKGNYKTEADALAARNFLALCSIQFTREILQNESTKLEYFCKLWGLANANDYPSLILQSLFGKKLKAQNPEFSFDCFLFAIYRNIWQRLESQRTNPNFVLHYQYIDSLIAQIPKMYPSQVEKYKDQIKEFNNPTIEGQLTILALSIEDFLTHERGWKLEWGLYDDAQISYLNSSMLCIECLELARVSDRSQIYRYLFT